MEFDNDYLHWDRYYREHILGDDDDEDYGDMEEQGYDAMVDDDVYDNVPQGGGQPNVFGDGRYNDEAGEETPMQRVWRDYHVLGYAEDDGDDRWSKPRSTRRERSDTPREIRFQPMSKKYREEHARREEEREAARIIRTNRAVCIAVAAAVLISLLLILL